MDFPVGRQTSKKQFWIEHIKAAESFDGTLKEYCEINSLKMGSMSSYRTKFGYSRPRRKVAKNRKSDFIPVKVSPRPPSATASQKLPDPNWLAQFLKAWGGQ